MLFCFTAEYTPQGLNAMRENPDCRLTSVNYLTLHCRSVNYSAARRRLGRPGQRSARTGRAGGSSAHGRFGKWWTTQNCINS
jgi:hypothetical protein